MSLFAQSQSQMRGVDCLPPAHSHKDTFFREKMLHSSRIKVPFISDSIGEGY